jgi:flagellar protein FlbT
MLMSPNDVADAKSLYHEHRCAILLVTENEDVKAGLEAVEELVEAKRYYDALRKIRGLFDIEQSILSGAPVLDAAQVA